MKPGECFLAPGGIEMADLGGDEVRGDLGGDCQQGAVGDHGDPSDLPVVVLDEAEIICVHLRLGMTAFPLVSLL